MRPCTPINHRTPPRESAVKSAPHPAAPVGNPSQTRGHHLTPSPNSSFAHTCKAAAEHFFFSTGRSAFSF